MNEENIQLGLQGVPVEKKSWSREELHDLVMKWNRQARGATYDDSILYGESYFKDVGLLVAFVDDVFEGRV